MCKIAMLGYLLRVLTCSVGVDKHTKLSLFGKDEDDSFVPVYQYWVLIGLCSSVILSISCLSLCLLLVFMSQ